VTARADQTRPTKATRKPTRRKTAVRTAPDTEHDSEELVITAARQLTLRCGESSITLTAAGKIIIRGKYIVSRSSGVQRIKGGAVQIN
jgi:hypothetical protein